MTLSQEQQVLLRQIKDRLRHRPDGHDKDEHLIIIAYEMGLESGRADPSEDARALITKKALLQLLDLLSIKRTSLSAVNEQEVQAIAVGWFDELSLTDLYDVADIPELPSEFLGKVFQHTLWHDQEKQKEVADE